MKSKLQPKDINKPDIRHGVKHKLFCGAPLKYNDDKPDITAAEIPTTIPESA